MVIGKVGSKGELFPPKEIREQLGFESGREIEYRVSNGTLIVEKILSPEEILSKPKKAIVTIEELKKDRLNLSEDAFK
jgi:bifunctional DNA-binding transcriptional regulator/antitoxin component of YhaV-PrlF toxin-antitoxin module